MSIWQVSKLPESDYIEIGNQMTAQILFAADNSVMLKMLSVMIAHYGYQVHQAECGEAALNALKRLKPDVLIAELHASDMDNYELCRQIRAKRHSARLPVVLIGPNDDDSQAKSLAAGANCYITTPVFLDRLLKAVDEVLKSRSV